ncbi:MAG TPA: DegT/DnrJ/EryC1/StrS family aminotransferase [Candidatus Aenigmarchaeota archaeon]|nr:DegT/DnrJ/EryC1/StrS family aminotransferase [Candidatus Aenigmarchaeota archaeon]
MIRIASPMIGEEEKKAVMEVLESGMLVQGPRVKELEEKFAEYIGTKYAVATSSGTSALHLALLALGIGPGDEVITTPFSFIATANSILFCGAKPVFVDIDPKTFNIDPNKIEEKITNKTKAILPVHLYGHPAEMKPILEIAREHGLKVLEDCAQAHGAEYRGKRVGSFGDCAAFSFYATKNMITGEGGMITTNDEEIAEKIRKLRNHGQSKTYEHETLGFNLRMTDIQAAIGLVQLKKLDKLNAKRAENAEFLTSELKDLVQTPYVSPGVKHVFHQYTIKVNNRDSLLKKLNDSGIGARVYYPKPIHKQPLYQKMGYRDSLPVAEKVSSMVISLPIHPALTEDDLNLIVDTIKSGLV